MRNWRLVLGAVVCVAAMVGCEAEETPSDDGGTGNDAATTPGTDAQVDTDSGTTPVVDGGVTDAGEDPEPDSGAPDAGGDPPAPTWAQIYDDIIGRRCTGCHAGGEGGLRFTDADSAYAALVNVRSACMGRDRVEPGDAAGSQLYHKVAGTQGPCGSRMPRAGDPLSDSQIEQIRAWIEAGAER